MRAAHTPTAADAVMVAMSIGALVLATAMYWRAATHVYDLGPVSRRQFPLPV